MSIFKESFKPFVRKQIEIKQTKIGQGDRTYFLQRQCTIRMSSGVDIEGSNKIAKENVLEGGTKIVTTTGEEGDIINNFSNKIGFNGAYDQPSDGFGYVPMPGITSVNIKTKTAYGSLREAIVKFECHSTKQLSLLEKLYMRPGYPCLLEWGWTPYIKNNGTTESNLVYLSNDNKFWNGEYDQDSLQRAIIAKKEKFESNYDGLYGIVKNFNYSVRPDGGYSCTTELISIGEVLESLGGRLSDQDNTKPYLEKTLEDLSQYAEALSNYRPTNEELNNFEEQIRSGSIKLPNETLYKGDISKYDQDRFNTAGPGYGSKQGLMDYELLREQEKQDFLANYSTLNQQLIKYFNTKDPNPSIWIKWRDFIGIINNSIPLDANSFPLIRVTHDDLDFNENLINDDLLTVSTGVQPKSRGTDLLQGCGIFTYYKNLSFSVNPNICLFPENIKRLLPGKAPILEKSRRIGDIAFEVSYLYKTFKSQYYTEDEFSEQVPNENFSIGNFIKKIWDDVNTSCGNGHNFQIQNDFERNHRIRIIDLGFTGEGITSNNLFTLNVLNTKSIVRDFNYDLSIPSALTSTIAIAAQNPDDPESLEEVTFAAFNRGVKNRFIKSKNNDLNWAEVGKNGWYSNASYSTSEKKLFKFMELKIALEVYLQRLKLTSDLDPGSPEFDTLIRAQSYNRGVEGDQKKIKLVGDPYTDYNEIPGSDLSSATIALKFLNTAKADLGRLSIPGRENRIIGEPKNTQPDISSIIPLKFNAKLDGISGIIIGNVFKIDPSKLPELYKDNKVAFIVTGEEQQIDGQDWTTTITGQAVMLPI
jgi:hypothetical protein